MRRHSCLRKGFLYRTLNKRKGKVLKDNDIGRKGSEREDKETIRRGWWERMTWKKTRLESSTKWTLCVASKDLSQTYTPNAHELSSVFSASSFLRLLFCQRQHLLSSKEFFHILCLSHLFLIADPITHIIVSRGISLVFPVLLLVRSSRILSWMMSCLPPSSSSISLSPFPTVKLSLPSSSRRRWFPKHSFSCLCLSQSHSFIVSSLHFVSHRCFFPHAAST